MADDVGLDLSQNIRADLRLMRGVGAEQLPHRPPLVAGDDHHQAVSAANLVIGPKLGCRHLGHGAGPARLGASTSHDGPAGAPRHLPAHTRTATSYVGLALLSDLLSLLTSG